MVGVWFGLIVYYFDSLWAVMAAHAAWNYTQNVIFGLPNSGITFKYSIFKLDAVKATDSFFYNVDFGVEGTWMAFILFAFVCVVTILVGRKKKLLKNTV